MTTLNYGLTVHTYHYKDFKKLLGSSIHNLNTICVGLEQINNEIETPPSLTISWHSKDKINDARRARRYAINLFLVATVDAIEYYITSLLKYEYLLSTKVKTKLNKAKQDNTGLREYIKILFEEVEDNKKIKEYWLPCIRLLISWRNIVVHETKAKVILERNDEQLLIDNKILIYEKHSKTNIEETIGRVKLKHQPTLKDFSTLFTILLHAFREFDNTISLNISELALKEMIRNNLGSKKLDSLMSDMADNFNSFKNVCEKYSIKSDYTNNESQKQELKMDLIAYFAEIEFNKLTTNKSAEDKLKRIKAFCETNSIPYGNEDLLKKINSIC